jgi:LPS export ABC transporter protein LptC
MRGYFLGTLLLMAGACSNERGVTPSRATSADSADQVMEQMAHTLTRDGIKSTYLEADSAWVYNERQVIDLKRVRITFYAATGAVRSTVTADSGTYNLNSGSLEARGHVVAVTPPPDSSTLRTEHLTFDRLSNLIRSDTAYTYSGSRGAGSGASFETDPDFRRFRSWQPRGRQRGEGFLLPGQDTTGT